MVDENWVCFVKSRGQSLGFCQRVIILRRLELTRSVAVTSVDCNVVRHGLTAETVIAVLIQTHRPADDVHLVRFDDANSKAILDHCWSSHYIFAVNWIITNEDQAAQSGGSEGEAFAPS